MSEPAAIWAAFTNIRNIQGRKVVQLICEIPTERAEEACKVLGWPSPVEPKWVAIALLDPVTVFKEAIIEQESA